MQAFARNVGTCHFDDKAKFKWAVPMRTKADAKYRGGMARSSDEALVMRVERRGHIIQL